MTRTMCCPTCGSEDVWEVEDVKNYTAILIDDNGEVVDVAANEIDFDSVVSVGMYCNRCIYREDYKSAFAEDKLTESQVRLKWSKIL